MKAARFHKVNHPLAVEEVPSPEPKSQEVLLKVKACGICGSDIPFPSGLERKKISILDGLILI